MYKIQSQNDGSSANYLATILCQRFIPTYYVHRYMIWREYRPYNFLGKLVLIIIDVGLGFLTALPSLLLPPLCLFSSIALVLLLPSITDELSSSSASCHSLSSSPYMLHIYNIMYFY